MNLKKLFSHPRAKIAIGVGAVLLLAIALILCLALWPKNKPQEAPAEAPQVTYETDVQLDVQYNTFRILMALPEQSNLQMEVQIKIGGEVVGKSEKLNPGESVQYIDYFGAPTYPVGQKVEGEFNLVFFNPESGAKITETAIPITIDPV